MDKKIKLIIVDDHEMFRAGVKVLLGKSNRIEIIGEAENGKEFLTLLEKNNPDVILMDIRMPVMDGIEATKKALAQNPDLKILTLSMFGDEEYYYKMLQAGARGFVLKSSGITQLEQAIESVARGSGFFSEELLKHVVSNIENVKSSSDISKFSEQEMKIMKLLSKNHSNDEIAQDLCMEVKLVQDKHKELLVKTGCNNTAALVLYAIKNKIVNI